MEETEDPKKTACKALMAKREAMEKELIELKEYLARPDIASFKTVDANGSPNPDCETLVAVRAARHRVSELTNDLKTVQKELEKALSEYFS